MRNAGFNIEDLEGDIRKSKCGFWDAVFTLGSSCVRKANARKEMQRAQ